MVIRTIQPKNQTTGKRSTLYTVSFDNELTALRSFANLADAAVVARFLAGANLADDLQERAVALLEGGERSDD